MSRLVNITGDAVKASRTVGVGFDPLPSGWYNCTIYDIEEKEFKNKGKHPGDTYLNLELRVAEGDFENRRVFAMVPLFERWAPGPKTPDGFPTLLIPFLEGLGYDLEDVEELEIPEDEDLIGEYITVRVAVEVDDYRLQQMINDGEIDGDDVEEGLVEPPARNNVQRFREYDENDDPSPSEKTKATVPAPKSKATPAKKGGKAKRKGTLDL